MESRMSTTVSAADISNLPPVFTTEGRDARPQATTKTNAHLIGWLMMVSYHSQSASAESFESLEELAHAVPSETDAYPEMAPVVNAIQAFAQTRIYDPLLAEKASTALHLLKGDIKIL